MSDPDRLKPFTVTKPVFGPPMLVLLEVATGLHPLPQSSYARRVRYADLASDEAFLAAVEDLRGV